MIFLLEFVLCASLLSSTTLTQDDQPPRPQIPGQPSVIETTSLKEILYSRQRPQEQSQAALQLLQLRSSESETIIRAELNRWERPDVFLALSSAIRMQRDTRFTTELLHGLGADSPFIRQAAIDSIAYLCPTGIEQTLVKLINQTDARPLARQGAVMALGNCGSKDAVASLLELLRSESQIVRQAVVTSLREISELEYGVDPFQWQQWWLPYSKLSEQQWQANRMRLFADRSRRLKDELTRAESALRDVNKNLFDKISRQERANYLRNLGSSDYPTLRDLAVTLTGEQLGQADLESTERTALVETVLMLSRDPHETVRQRAVLLLDKADSKMAYEWLLALLHDRSAKVRMAAARTLGRHPQAIRTPQNKEMTAQVLEGVLEDAIPSVSAAAVESIGKLNCPGTVKKLIALLRSTVPEEVRKAASEAISPIASLDVLNDLLTAVEDTVPEVRFHIVPALGQIAASAAINEATKKQIIQRVLRVLAQDRDAGVRSRAAYVMGNIGSPFELVVLWQSVKEGEDARVQERAWQAILEILGRNQSIDLLREWDEFLKKQSEPEKRIQLLQDTKDRWKKAAPNNNSGDSLQSMLVEAFLDYKRWQPAIPIAIDQAKNVTEEQQRVVRIRTLYRIAQMALDDRKAGECAALCRDVQENLNPDKELALLFSQLRLEAEKLMK